jgi:hypothetical protein
MGPPIVLQRSKLYIFLCFVSMTTFEINKIQRQLFPSRVLFSMCPLSTSSFSGTIDGYAGFVVMATSSSNWSLLSLDEPRLTADTNLFFEAFFFFFPLKFRLWSNLQLPNQIQFKNWMVQLFRRFESNFDSHFQEGETDDVRSKDNNAYENDGDQSGNSLRLPLGVK